ACNAQNLQTVFHCVKPRHPTRRFLSAPKGEPISFGRVGATECSCSGTSRGEKSSLKGLEVCGTCTKAARIRNTNGEGLRWQSPQILSQPCPTTNIADSCAVRW